MANERNIEVLLKLRDEMSGQAKTARENVKTHLTGMQNDAKETQGAFSKVATEIGSSWTGALKTMAVGWVSFEAVSKFKEMANASLELGKHIEDTSRKMNLSTDSYQKLSYMAKMSGTDIDNMGMAISKLSVMAVKSNSIMGVSTHDMNGHVKDSGALFEELLQKIAGIQNPTERLAVSMQLFGRAGREVYGMASQGKEKLSELADQTHRYHTILSENLISSLDRAKSAQERMNVSLQTMGARIMGTLAPALEVYAKVLSGVNVATAIHETQTERTIDKAKSENDINKLFELRAETLKKINDLQGEKNKNLSSKGAFDFDGREQAYNDKEITYKINQLKDEAKAYAGAMSEMSKSSGGGNVDAEDLFNKKVDKEEKDAAKKAAREAALEAKKAAKKAALEEYQFSGSNTGMSYGNMSRMSTTNATLQYVDLSAQADRSEFMGSDSDTGYTRAGGGASNQMLPGANSLREETSLKRLQMMRKKSYDENVKMYSGMADQVIKIGDNIAQMQMHNIEAQKQSETEAVEHSHMSAQRKQKAIEKINKEALEKERQIKKEQQVMSEAQAVISGAVAIMQGYAQNGPIIGTIEAVLMAAVTATEVAEIASQKFATGGVVQQKYGRGGTDSEPVMMTPGEVALRPDQFAMLRGGSGGTSGGTHHYDMSITIGGNASQSTVSQIRSAQADMVKQLKQTQRAQGRLRQAA